MPSSTRQVTRPEDSTTHPPPPHTPAHEYTYRVPSPPRVVVPPPTHANGFSAPQITGGAGSDYESNGFANTEFLETVTYGDCMNPDSMLTWQYEQRRMAQKILPFLFLGPYSAARDLDFLRQEGITMVMAVRDTMSAAANLLSSRMALKAGIQSCNIDVAGNQELIAAFPRAIEAINAHLCGIYREEQRKNVMLQSHGQPPLAPMPGKVLVFCESGNERSAGVITAYIMAMYSIAVVPAIQIVQTQRFCVSFDDSMRYLLQSYDSILQAKRDVLRSSSMMNAPPLIGPRTESGREHVNAAMDLCVAVKHKSSKRTLDEADDDDMEMGGDGGERDDARFEKREGFAPFEDVTES
ncbi:hypothetical protein MMC30_007704 [Trapelia coarctata]|nr:hypothetical protein [Trapelia coarctata]